MYGMIHAFLKSTITDLCGPTAWRTIESKASVNGVDYYGMQQYPDEIAQNLVKATAIHLDQGVDATWRQIGKHWVPYTRAGLYASYYERAHGALDFLEELNRIHARVEEKMPLIQPPTFKIERVSKVKARLHYRSKRTDLGAFLHGSLEGLAALYRETISVSELTANESIGSGRIFLLETELQSNVDSDEGG